MKASAILEYAKFLLGLIIMSLVSCTGFDDLPTPVLTRYDLPPEILESIFTKDIPKEIRNVDNFLDKIKQNGMVIHEGVDPPEIYTLDGNTRMGVKFNIASDCIYDGEAPSNVDSVYGKYEETIQISMDSSNQSIFLAEVSYTSVGDADYLQYPNGLDKGSGRGYVSGSGNNFTVFYRVGNGTFDNIPYEAIWIISGTVPNPQNVREITNVTKCLVMLKKGEDQKDKIADRGTIRIFKDESPDWIQPDIVIAGFSPPEGHYSTVVTINGSGFSLNKDENSVKINKVSAKVLNASTDQLIVEVPKGAGTGPVSVQVLGKSDDGNVFTYIKVYTVSTLAGNGKPAFLDGSGDIAMFNNPYGVAVDAEGTVYVADSENNRIRKITPDVEVSTLRISDPDGAIDAIFNNPLGVAVDAKFNVYVADTEKNRIRKITPTGIITNLQNCTFSQGKQCFSAFFNQPSGVVVDNRSNVYVADGGNNDNEAPSILKITETGIISTLASINQSPSGLAVDALGNVYVADTGNNLIRKITPADEVVTLGGPTQFNSPTGVAIDADGNIYVADRANHQIKKITPAGVVSVLAGTGQAGFLDGIGNTALFNNPSGVAIDKLGIIYVTDSTNHRIRKMVLE